MAVAITLLYILAELLGPSLIFGPLAEYRIELFVALAALLASVPRLAASQVFTSRMTFALFGLAFAVVGSTLASGWLGAITVVGYGLLPVLMGFILVAINCRTKRHLQLVILTLFAGSVFVIANGYLALQTNQPSPYVYMQGVEGEAILPRLRGLEFLNDPNDFAQLLVSLLPLLFFFARKESFFRNRLLIPGAALLLLWGMYLTRSRGGTLALMATIILAAKRRIGLVPAAVVGALLFVAAIAVGYSGGREISSTSGADRIELWAIGLALVRTHFFFGVGVGNFWDYAPNTAHNSVVICASELGVTGLLFWVMFILSTVRGAVLLERDAPALAPTEDPVNPYLAMLASKAPIAPLTTPAIHPPPSTTKLDPFRPQPMAHAASHTEAGNHQVIVNPFHPSADEPEPTSLPDEEIRRMARLILYSLTGFLAAGWFLSRALSIWLFIYCGMMHVVLQLAHDNKIAVQRDGFPFLFRWSAIIALGLLTLISIIIRVSH